MIPSMGTRISEMTRNLVSSPRACFLATGELAAAVVTLCTVLENVVKQQKHDAFPVCSGYKAHVSIGEIIKLSEILPWAMRLYCKCIMLVLHTAYCKSIIADVCVAPL